MNIKTNNKKLTLKTAGLIALLIAFALVTISLKIESYSQQKKLKELQEDLQFKQDMELIHNLCELEDVVCPHEIRDRIQLQHDLPEQPKTKIPEATSYQIPDPCDLPFMECNAQETVQKSIQPQDMHSTSVVEAQILALAEQTGFQWPSYLIRLAKCENRPLDPKLDNAQGNYPAHSVDRGIFQINSYWHAEVSDECAYDIGCSTLFTIDMINNGRQKEWVCDEIIRNVL